MPRACAAIVMRVWSRVRSAILKPSPSSPTSRSAGIAQSSKYSSRVGEPLMPSLCSGAPNVKPGSPSSSTKAEIPFAPASGSVTAITV